MSSTAGKLLRVNVHAGNKVDARTQKVAHHNVSHVHRCGDARMANISHGVQVKVSGDGARGSHGKQLFIASADHNGRRENTHGSDNFLLGKLTPSCATVALDREDVFNPVFINASLYGEGTF